MFSQTSIHTENYPCTAVSDNLTANSTALGMATSLLIPEAASLLLAYPGATFLAGAALYGVYNIIKNFSQTQRASEGPQVPKGYIDPMEDQL